MGRSRRRIVGPLFAPQYSIRYSAPPFATSGAYDYYSQGTTPMTLKSESVCIDKVNPGPPYRSGGNLIIMHEEENRQLESFKCSLDAPGAYTQRLAEGSRCILAVPYVPEALRPVDWTDRLFDLGSTGMARAKPEIAKASVGVFIAELRDLPRSGTIAVGRGRSQSSGAAPSHLGNEFGLGATFRDIQKIYDVQQNMAETLKQLSRDNGKSIRRKRTLLNHSETIVESIEEGGSYQWLYPYVGLVPGSQKRITTLTVEQKVWYEGKFRYYIPERLFTDEWDHTLMARVQGAEVSLDVAWNAMPWTWLYDWFFNMGDLISNLSAAQTDNLVQEYGYVMGTQKVVRRHDVRYVERDESFNLRTRYLSASNSVTRKQRVAGFPYSFGANPNDLTVGQVFILGALGISRSGGRI